MTMGPVGGDKKSRLLLLVEQSLILLLSPSASSAIGMPLKCHYFQPQMEAPFYYFSISIMSLDIFPFFVLYFICTHLFFCP